MWNILFHTVPFCKQTVKFMTSKKCKQSVITLYTVILYFMAKSMYWSYDIVLYRQYIASIAAAEKRPLSYQTPQSVHMARKSKLWCPDLAIDNALRGWKLGKIGEGMVGFWPHRTRSYFWVSRLRCKFSLKLRENCDRRTGDRQRDEQTDAVIS